VSKERQGKSAIFGAVAIAVIGIVISVMLTTSSRKQLDDARAANDEAKPKADAAVQESGQAETLIAQAAQTIKDANLAQAMIAHNDVYPDFYTKTIIPYIPPFFRIQSLSATPNDGLTCTVTMVGTLKSYQQYADLALALMRIPDAVSVGRGGYTGPQSMVPALTPQDQIGKYRRTTDAPIPDDPQDQLSYLEAQGSAPVGYQNVGGFGSGTTDVRGATPDESLITIQLTVVKNLQTPDPPATLRTSGAAPAAGGGFPGPGGPPGMPGVGGPPGGPPAGMPAAAAGGGGSKKEDGSGD
jgi:hypothetical protein